MYAGWNTLQIFFMNIRRVRIVTGLVLFTYLTTHLLNHSLGLISLDAMEAGRVWFLALWRNPIGTIALYGALLTHFALALYAIYQRRHLRLRLGEALQLALGLCIPLILATHFVGTRVAYERYGIEDLYAKIVLGFWRQNPTLGVRQAALVVIAWTHGCIGLYFWLRLRPWFPRVAAALYAFALLLPVCALLGFVHAGQEVDYHVEHDPGWIERLNARTNVLRPSQRDDLSDTRDAVVYGFWALLAAVLAARGARHAFERRRRICITYPDGRQARVPRGFTVLEASRFARIPHASVCGGRGRCSTCRIRVVKGSESLPPPSAAELKVLHRIGAAPSVRLACQLRPDRDIAIMPLLPADAQASDGFARPSSHAGRECEVTVLFADLRSFTTIAEHKLPYDVVFILNRYAEIVGTAIERAGGIPNQFTGDGLMALFGIQTTPEEGCRAALAAAREIVGGVARLSEMLSEELDAALKVGVGIHAGPSVVGQMGYGVATYLTAVGDTVNVASRLQDLTKEYDCALVISDVVAKHAGVTIDASHRREVSVRNRQTPLMIYAVGEESALLAWSAAPTAS
jgi:adenylate cyclase